LGRAVDLVEISAMELYWMARTIIGCVFGDVEPARDIPRVLDHALQGHIDVRTMITDRVTLSEIPEALRRLERGEGLRTVVDFPGWDGDGA
jgi:S-(hydroxymethyl)glutathione dehydrogenase/alcohol dehydrogenase